MGNCCSSLLQPNFVSYTDKAGLKEYNSAKRENQLHCRLVFVGCLLFLQIMQQDSVEVDFKNSCLVLEVFQ